MIRDEITERSELLEAEVDVSTFEVPDDVEEIVAEALNLDKLTADDILEDIDDDDDDLDW